MKIMFVEARKKFIGKPKLDEIASLPDEIHILYSIQYKELAENIKKELEKQNKKIVKIEQVLGCSKITPKATLLLVGNGRFHALNLALSTNKEIFIYDNGKLNKISEQEITKLKKQEKGKLSKFLISDKIGILVSSKPGQSKLKSLNKIKTKLESKYPDKKFYTFLTDNINLAELENFQIDFWLNTACPGIELDSSKIINYEKVLI